MSEANASLSHRLQSLLAAFVVGQDNVANGLLLVENPAFKWKGACGMAVPEQGVPMHPDDQFNIDSIAKMMTATIVMKQVEAGELKLRDRISQYLPGGLMDGLHVYEGRSYGDKIELCHLLNHTSGIADNWAHSGFLDLILANPQRRWTPQETIAFVKEHCPPAFPPGGGFQYSDPGYNLVGLILEEVVGKPLHEIYRGALLDPLGMNQTYRPSHETTRPSLLGRGPSHRYFGDLECTLLPAVMTADWAGGGLISTSEDLNRFLRAFVKNEIFENPSTRDAMYRWVKSGPFHEYGMGISHVVFTQSDEPEKHGLGQLWGHTGSSDNFMYYWPEQRTTMIGTLNQIACERSLYDNVAEIMVIIKTYRP